MARRVNGSEPPNRTTPMKPSKRPTVSRDTGRYKPASLAETRGQPAGIRRAGLTRNYATRPVRAARGGAAIAPFRIKAATSVTGTGRP